MTQRLYSKICIPVLAAILMAGCGGGSSPQSVQQPPATADFSLAFSTNTVNVSQGSTSQGVTLSVTAQNGFTGSVQIVLSGIPASVTSDPLSPFSLAAGSTATVLFSATPATPTGS